MDWRQKAGKGREEARTRLARNLRRSREQYEEGFVTIASPASKRPRVNSESDDEVLSFLSDESAESLEFVDYEGLGFSDEDLHQSYSEEDPIRYSPPPRNEFPMVPSVERTATSSAAPEAVHGYSEDEEDMTLFDFPFRGQQEDPPSLQARVSPAPTSVDAELQPWELQLRQITHAVSVEVQQRQVLAQETRQDRIRVGKHRIVSLLDNGKIAKIPDSSDMRLTGSLKSFAGFTATPLWLAAQEHRRYVSLGISPLAETLHCRPFRYLFIYLLKFGNLFTTIRNTESDKRLPGNWTNSGKMRSIVSQFLQSVADLEQMSGKNRGAVHDSLTDAVLSPKAFLRYATEKRFGDFNGLLAMSGYKMSTISGMLRQLRTFVGVCASFVGTTPSEREWAASRSDAAQKFLYEASKMHDEHDRAAKVKRREKASFEANGEVRHCTFGFRFSCSHAEQWVTLDQIKHWTYAVAAIVQDILMKLAKDGITEEDGRLQQKWLRMVHILLYILL
jgi:hypothetical protein